jgi:hypothetical protein
MAFGIKNNIKSIQQYSTKANTTINMRLEKSSAYRQDKTCPKQNPFQRPL